ncbi:MAG TPA: N-methyl-L-tryptophan oxidase [Xanthobacteraceae bacterium]|nr:N-methyl-L-tryptophan oxidase [Xanthobacteraceae bacterium]
MLAFDVAVVGLGAMGSAALAALARRGLRAIGIEQFTPGHDRGSSHGRTRLIRLGYFEHPSYVPLLREAYPLWREIEARSGQSLLHVTGIVEIGPPRGRLVEGTLRSAREHGLTHEVLDAGALMRRFPAFRLPADVVGVFQPDGGFLMAEAAIEAQIVLARADGAQMRTGERVTAIEAHGTGVRITTEHGRIEAGAAIVTAGPWLKQLLPDLPVPLRVTRQVLGWFAPKEPALFAEGRFPVFLLESPHGLHYGFPLDGAAGVKIAKHHHLGEEVDAASPPRTVTPADEEAIRSAVAAYLPQANGPLISATTCLYTMTPDEDFVLDHLPGHPQIVVGSPCSGHGFKFSPVIGAILADLATAGTTRRDIARFRLARFA